MQITINDEKIDYTLESEKNLFDVLGGLRSWLKSEGFVLMTARTEERALDLGADQELREISIDAVNTLSVQAQTAIEKEHGDLVAVSEFFRILKAGVELGEPQKTKELLSDYPFLRDGLNGLLARHAVDSREVRSEELDRIISSSTLLENGSIEGQPRTELFAYIDALIEALAERRSEMEHPVEELLRAAEELRSSSHELEEVSVMLQTGRDQDAMAAVVRFVERSSRIVRLYPVLKQTGGIDFNTVVVDGVAFPAFYAEFNSILSELIEAFTAEDSVLIGDLLEYEISPRLETLNSYIDLLTRNDHRDA